MDQAKINFFKSADDFSVPYFEYVPDDKIKSAIVLIYEIFGATNHIHKFADKLAKKGYLVYLPDIFSRVEIAVPIEDKTLSRRIISEGLRYYLDDNTNAWILRSSGKYCRIASRKKRKYGAQKRLINELSHF